MVFRLGFWRKIRLFWPLQYFAQFSLSWGREGSGSLTTATEGNPGRGSVKTVQSGHMFKNLGRRDPALCGPGLSPSRGTDSGLGTTGAQGVRHPGTPSLGREDWFFRSRVML